MSFNNLKGFNESATDTLHLSASIYSFFFEYLLIGSTNFQMHLPATKDVFIVGFVGFWLKKKMSGTLVCVTIGGGQLEEKNSNCGVVKIETRFVCELRIVTCTHAPTLPLFLGFFFFFGTLSRVLLVCALIKSSSSFEPKGFTLEDLFLSPKNYTAPYATCF